MPRIPDNVWESLCDLKPQFFLMLVIAVLLLFVSIVTFPFVDPNSAAGILIKIDLMIFTAVLIPISYILYRCRTHEQSENLEGR